ncbi:RidA family protein [Microbacterium sp. MPKO10]|uniref:RidA family protein n=1 Tax=Microbacterium sp. MPKO10 TaxID=2989818 RepID=UPI002236BCB3|nr:RidA family protein [Microbacterium sp. MPKO10]MCW4458905.1 RidA family protein [Microbacterium sp. MPKO10]
MTVHTFSPDGMFQPVPYHHVSVATGSRQVHVAGQIARDADGGHIATGDLIGQMLQAMSNTARGLAGAGASFADVVRLRFFVVDWSVDKNAAFMEGLERATRELDLSTPLPPISMIGVDYLFEPDVLIEVEAYAVLD